MTAAEILNRRQETLVRLREWRKNPKIPKSFAYRLCRVSRQRLDALLLSGRVSVEVEDFEEMIPIDSLLRYFAGFSKANKSRQAGKLRSW